MSNSVRFTLAQFADWCMHSISVIKLKCQVSCEKLIKSKKGWLQIFVYFNLVLSTLTLIFFTFSTKRYNGLHIKLTSPPARIIFLINLTSEWILSFCLVHAHRKKKAFLCQFWCLGEIIAILVFLLLTLPDFVYIVWQGKFILLVEYAIKLFGIWALYYHSLKLKSDSLSDYFVSSDPNDKFKWHPRHLEEDGMNINYFARGGTKRRDTEVTSISSEPQSPSPFVEENENNDVGEEDYNNEASCSGGGAGGSKRKISSTSTPSQFKFFADADPIRRGDLMELYGEQPRYSEIMIGHHHAKPTLKKDINSIQSQFSVTMTKSKDNIIISSDLMCGGTSEINTC